MSFAHYDTRSAMERATESLDTFHKIAKERREAGYKRGERLREWHLFDGAISFDTCGNTGRGVRSEIIKGNVFSRQEYNNIYQMLSEKGKDMFNFSYGHGGNPFPRPNMCCPICGVEWTIENFLDSVAKREDMKFIVEDYVGKTVREYEDARRDTNIYTTLFVHEKEEYTRDYVIEENDFASVNCYSFYHENCMHLEATFEMQHKFREIFARAGFKMCLFNPIKDEYYSHAIRSKWFMVNTEFGDIKLGWRKRVISIHCDDLDMSNIAPEDATTMGYSTLHAWGYEKLEEYLTTMCEQLKEMAG